MTRKCPDLHDPLKPGFHSGGNGGQGHSHDEEDSAPLLGRWSENKMVGGDKIAKRVEIIMSHYYHSKGLRRVNIYKDKTGNAI